MTSISLSVITLSEMEVIALTPFQRFLRIPDPRNFYFRNPKSIGKFC